MPYIPRDRRDKLDPFVDEVVDQLRLIDATKGDVNYVVTRIALEALRPLNTWSYHTLSAAVGALKDAAAEIERRLLGPYEDQAILKNGDMQCYDEPFALKPDDD